MRINNLQTSAKKVGIILGTVVSIIFGAYLNQVPSLAQTDISKGYVSEDTLPVGTLVSLKKDSIDTIETASSENASALLGVAINANSASISLLSGTSEVQVATSGTLPVLVTNINGDIQNGDHITASPIKGVGMKATANTRIIGIAQGGIIPSSASQHVYKDSAGNEKTALIGQVPVIVNVSYFFKEPEKTIIPSTLQNLANTLAGREVNTLPIIVSAAIFIVTIIVVSSIIYSMIRSSIISVGRNPLSQSAIYRDLIQLSALVLVILAVAVVAIYFVLTRL